MFTRFAVAAATAALLAIVAGQSASAQSANGLSPMVSAPGFRSRTRQRP